MSASRKDRTTSTVPRPMRACSTRDLRPLVRPDGHLSVCLFPQGTVDGVASRCRLRCGARKRVFFAHWMPATSRSIFPSTVLMRPSVMAFRTDFSSHPLCRAYAALLKSWTAIGLFPQARTKHRTFPNHSHWRERVGQITPEWERSRRTYRGRVCGSEGRRFKRMSLPYQRQTSLG